MFDYLRCDAPLPDDRMAPDTMFQTKSLQCSLDQFTITREGRLIYHCRHYEAGPKQQLRPAVWLPQYKLVHAEDINMEYHGDILFGGSTRDDKFVEFVARFTHGILEWIRPHEELSEIHKSWFYAKD